MRAYKNKLKLRCNKLCERNKRVELVVTCPGEHELANWIMIIKMYEPVARVAIFIFRHVIGSHRFVTYTKEYRIRDGFAFFFQVFIHTTYSIHQLIHASFTAVLPTIFPIDETCLKAALKSNNIYHLRTPSS